MFTNILVAAYFLGMIAGEERHWIPVEWEWREAGSPNDDDSQYRGMGEWDISNSRMGMKSPNSDDSQYRDMRKLDSLRSRMGMVESNEDWVRSMLDSVVPERNLKLWNSNRNVKNSWESSKEIINHNITITNR